MNLNKPRAITLRVYFAYCFENKRFCKRNILLNFDILMVIAVGHLFELNRCKLNINNTVFTGRATDFVDDMQIHHFFLQESVYHFLKFAA